MLSIDWKIKVYSYTKEISDYKNENKDIQQPIKVKILVPIEDRKSAKIKIIAMLKDKSNLK